MDAYAGGGLVGVLREDTSALPRQLQSRGKQGLSVQLKSILVFISLITCPKGGSVNHRLSPVARCCRRSWHL